MNNRRKLLVALGASAFAAPFASFAQQQGKVWRIYVNEFEFRYNNRENPDIFGAAIRAC